MTIPDLMPAFQMSCPLPHLTYAFADDEFDAADIIWQRCDSDIYLSVEESRDLSDPTVRYQTWKVECTGGHVLVLPEGTGSGGCEPYDHGQVIEALTRLNTL